MRSESWLKLKALPAKSGLSQSTLYEHMATGLFPRSVRVSTTAVAWPESEVEAVVNARVRGESDAQIRKLVASMHSARKTAGLSSTSVNEQVADVVDAVVAARIAGQSPTRIKALAKRMVAARRLGEVVPG